MVDGLRGGEDSRRPRGVVFGRAGGCGGLPRTNVGARCYRGSLGRDLLGLAVATFQRVRVLRKPPIAEEADRCSGSADEESKRTN